MEDVRTAILSRRVAAAPANSAERTALEQELTATVQVGVRRNEREDRTTPLATQSDCGNGQHDRSSCFGCQPW